MQVAQISVAGEAALGGWLLRKWQARLFESDDNFFAVARQMRKQGYPLDVALSVLLGKGERS